MVDFEKPFNSVEELEKVLEEEFKKSESDKEDEEESEKEDEEESEKEDEEESDEEETEETDKEDEQSDDDEDKESDKKDDKSKQDNTKSKKLTGDEKFSSDKHNDKKDFAFKELRKDNSDLKQKLTEREKKIAVWEDIAKTYGYQSAEEMAKVIKERKLEQEAKQKNVDPDMYKRLNEMEERVSRAEKEKQEQQFDFKKREFVGVFNSFIKENNLSDDERKKIVENLEGEGWDFESLVGIKNPKRLLQGYAADIIADRKVQKNLEEEKNKKLSESKFKNNSKNDKDVDALVKADLEKYARERGLKF